MACKESRENRRVTEKGIEERGGTHKGPSLITQIGEPKSRRQKDHHRSSGDLGGENTIEISKKKKHGPVARQPDKKCLKGQRDPKQTNQKTSATPQEEKETSRRGGSDRRRFSLQPSEGKEQYKSQKATNCLQRPRPTLDGRCV